MNEYLKLLEKALRHMGTDEKQDILADYAEHFEIGLEAGKSEQQIEEELGDPDALAKMYTAMGATKRAHETKGVGDTISMIGAIIRYKVGGGLVMAMLYFAAVSVMFCLFAAAAGIAAGGIGALGYAVMMFVQGYASFGAIGIFTFMMLLGGGMLGIVGCKNLWKITVGNLSNVARKIMQKRVTINELDIDKA